MLGDINPQTIKIDQQAVVYPGRDHVTVLTIKRYDGRSYRPVDTSALTRVVLVFPDTDPTIAYDSDTLPAVFDWTGSTVTIDLSDYAMPASSLPCYLIAFDAEHPAGQVLVDNEDTTLEFDFRNISTTGTVPAPAVEFITDAPVDGETYGRKDGAWVTLEAIVSGVASVNGQTGVVNLSAADVGADPAGEATAEVALHEAALDPHPQYSTDADLAAHVADTTPHETILDLDRVGFSMTPTGPAGVGEVVWNATDATLDLGLPGGSTLQVGQEFLVRGRNTSGTTMVDGTVVYVSGALGARAVFSRAQANQSTADKTIGVITQDLANNSDGFCTLAGLVRNFDTSGWAEGVELWLSAATAGGLTATKPAPPNNAVRVGQVIRSHATQGQILVRVQIIEALRELHDVNVTAPADGDILVYDSATQTWLNEPNTGGTGEVNTASNLGAGTGLFAGKVVADLQFKSLVEGTGVTITSDATTVTINASGAGGAVDSVNSQTGVVVLTTTDIAEGTNLYYTNARASAAAPVQSVNGQTGAVDLSGAYAPLSHVGDGGAAHANAVASGAAGFMSGSDKAKLDGIAAGATANSTTDTLAEGSSNKYFTESRVLATLMTGLTLIAGGAVLAADSLLVAIGKLQKQINDLFSGKQDTLVSGTNIKTINGNSLLGSGDLTVGREILTADRTYYVRTDGNDSNNGLANTSGGAFLTVQRAVNAAASVDSSTYQTTIAIADGTYTGVVVVGALIGANPLIILGNATTPSNVHLNATGTAITTVAAEARIVVTGVKISATAVGLNATPAGVIEFSNIVFGACSSRQIGSQFNGFVNATGSYSIEGGAAQHALASQGGKIRFGAVTVTLTGTPNFSAAFVVAGQGPSLITLAASPPTFSGSATGKRYNVDRNAVIDTNGAGATFFPGNADGTSATGGQYA